MLTVDFIGAGNVATRMATGLHASGVKIGRIFSRTVQKAQALADKVDATVATLAEIGHTDSDMVVIAVHDDAITEILGVLNPPSGSKTIWTHTAGSVPMSVFSPEKFPNYGIFYPLQTMSMNMEVDWSRVPMFVEGSSADVEQKIADIARNLTDSVRHLDSDHRASLHAAAVIGCNMAVYLWSLSAKVMENSGLDFELMRPLLEVTLERTKSLSPIEAMTGPARRGDVKTIMKHLASLPPEVASTYRTLSESILREYHPEIILPSES